MGDDILKLKILPILIATFVIFFLSSTASFAKDKWDTTDKILFTSFTALMVVDYGQTQDIFKRQSEGYYEKSNIIIKKYGQKSVLPWFIVSEVGAWLIADQLPSKWRKTWLVAVNALEIKMIHNNYSIGLKVNF
jgi:hypothetical protein